MKTRADYLDSLDDGRIVYFQGERVDVREHPAFAFARDAIVATYDRYHVDDPSATNPMYAVPRSTDDLRERIELLRHADVVASTTFQSLLSLLTAAPAVAESSPVYGDRIKAYYEHVVTEDLRLVECITDAKGDRSLSPGQQADPDSYVRVVERRDGGVVIRGAKLHITGAPLAHEMLVMPTKQMKPGEEQYAISCAVPVAAPGVSIVATTFDAWPRDPRDHPFSSAESMPDGFIVFDDVFVPDERVFLDGEVQHSAAFAHSLGLWERLGGTALMADEADTIVGLAQLVAEANGIARVPHVKEKISEIIMYATVIRGCLEAALVHVGRTEEGMVFPSELYTNTAKFYGAANYNLVIRHLHDMAGGIVATVPSSRDMENEDIGPALRQYVAAAEKVTADERVKIMRAVKDFTADSFGGWRFVTNLQSGGGLFAQRLVTRKHYDMDTAVTQARHHAGLGPSGA